MSGVAVGVAWAALSVYVVLLVAVASWVVGLLCGSGLVCWWAVLLAVWSSAGLAVGVARSTSGSELELRGWMLLGGVCSEVLLSPALSSPRTVWSVAVVGVWLAGGGCCCCAGGSSVLGLAAVVSAEGRLLPYVPHGRVWRFRRSFQSMGFDSFGGCRGCEGAARGLLVLVLHGLACVCIGSPIQVRLGLGGVVLVGAVGDWPATIRICRLCFGPFGCRGLLVSMLVYRRPGSWRYRRLPFRPRLPLCLCLGLLW